MVEIVRFRDEGLGNSSYLVDLGDGRGLVLDPSRDPGPYLAGAEQRGLRLVWTVETHLHADFVSGSRELAPFSAHGRIVAAQRPVAARPLAHSCRSAAHVRNTRLAAKGATVVAPAAAGLQFPHRGLRDGEELDLGGLLLQALATPGHTPEHLAYVLADGNRPLGLFSGGSLLVGAVARTDLISPDRTEELARALWRSLHERILTLPDDLPVYPTHGAGSFCSAPVGAEPTTTIGREKATNPLLAAEHEDAFVGLLLGGLGSYPRYFLRLRETNRRGPRVYGATVPPLAQLSPQQVQRQAAGAELVDARPIEAFASGHVPGALSIPLRDAFATWLGWLVPDDRPLVVVLDADQDRDDLVRQCLKVGYERLEGELAGGMAAWRADGLPEVRIALADIADHTSGTVLDVRQQAEFTSGHLPGAHHVELGALAGDQELPAGPMEVMCGHGQRAMTGASLLQRAGRGDLTVLVGGASDWAKATGRPLDAP